MHQKYFFRWFTILVSIHVELLIYLIQIMSSVKYTLGLIQDMLRAKCVDFKMHSV